MKLYQLAIIRPCDLDLPEQSRQKTLILASQSDLSSYSFFQRGSVGEFINFFSTTVAERAKVGQAMVVTQNEHVAHVLRSAKSLCVVAVTDLEYPPMVARSLIGKITNEFGQKFSSQMVDDASSKDELSLDSLSDYIVKYQDPKQADNIMKMQVELDQTKAVMHQTIESLLERNEKLDSLVDKSNDLSMQSKAFYKTAKQTNSCCIVM
ncbi:palmitoyltransferase [Coemansia sp. RSA 1358]|uniref:Synaptobrevin homolog YKT6 n=1 Tax=Coemansia umbellata TaxID=1424467 RepID=A0ABQ8PJY1_9FUNG|nr:Longin-like domain-containing protein [Coemansia spiralis]KAJ1990749.1 palmitoyltransferase [Coemansia umbellata]KAJ2620907.1 palmitoyltransferase [Coemansia sp. RSA 1358]